MTDILTIILPVFLVIAFGYGARWRGYVSDEHIDGLMKFAQSFAIPCLLFRAISSLDLGQNFELPLLTSFYAGAIAGFTAGALGARFLFSRSWEDAVAIGFCALFSNSLLLGLPITERAYGVTALEANYAIIAIHAPMCYGIGITAMEVARAATKGTPLSHLPVTVLRAMFSNALVIGISLGFVVNLTSMTVPIVLTDAVDLMVRAALPAALFGLGGVLYRYRPEGDMRVILYVCCLALVLHPSVTFGLARLQGLGTDALRSALVTAAMAPGINAYVFANMYGAARRVAASAVLIATALSIVSTTFWLTILP